MKKLTFAGLAVAALMAACQNEDTGNRTHRTDRGRNKNGQTDVGLCVPFLPHSRRSADIPQGKRTVHLPVAAQCLVCTVHGHRGSRRPDPAGADRGTGVHGVQRG